MTPEEEQAEIDRWASRRAAMPVPVLEKQAAIVISRPGGLPELPEETYGCPECRDRGRVVNLATRRARSCECRHRLYEDPEDVPAIDLEARGVPPGVAGALKSDWDPKYQHWCPEFDAWPHKMAGADGAEPKFILIWGSAGSGKSAAASWILRRAVAAGRSAHWIGIRSTIDKLKRGMSDGAPVPVDAWLRRGYRVLDDVGIQDPTEYQDGLVLSWINTCYESPGFTIVTTNLTKDELRERDFRAASRMLSGVVIHMIGPDARRKRWQIKKREPIDRY